MAAVVLRRLKVTVRRARRSGRSLPAGQSKRKGTTISEVPGNVLILVFREILNQSCPRDMPKHKTSHFLKDTH